jgi:hypothetical protein
MSKAEDFVVVEDQSSQPRMLANGQLIEYGPTYKQLRSISHGKPVVAVTIAEGDYHTPPNLVRLAMAEAAANGASYLSWPTWPEEQRVRMIESIRPQAEFLKAHEALLNDTQPRADVVLFLPFRDWLQTGKCRASELAAALTRANIQYEVLCEDDLQSRRRFGQTKVLLIASSADLQGGEPKLVERFVAKGGRAVSADQADWLRTVQNAIATPAIAVDGAKSVRAAAHDQKRRTIVHLLNLNVQRLSSFQDKVEPVSDLRLSVRVPFKAVRSVRALTADPNASSGDLAFTTHVQHDDSSVEVSIPRLDIATILVIER